MKSVIRRGTTSGLALLLVVIAIAMVPTPASAAEVLVMQVPGIPGSSKVVGHVGWITVISFAGAPSRRQLPEVRSLAKWWFRSRSTLRVRISGSPP